MAFAIKARIHLLFGCSIGHHEIACDATSQPFLGLKAPPSKLCTRSVAPSCSDCTQLGNEIGLNQSFNGVCTSLWYL